MDYVVILPCAAMDGYPLDDDPWRQHFWTTLDKPMMFGHRGNGTTLKTNPLVQLKCISYLYTYHVVESISELLVNSH